MSILRKAGLCLAEYLKLREAGKLPAPERPKSCGPCRKVNCYWAHGSYRRRVEEGSENEEIRVPRWKCRWCGGTQSEPPYFVVPNRRYAVKVLAAGVQGYAVNPTKYRDEVAKLGETGPSPAQLFRWVKLLGEKAKTVLFDVQSLYISSGLDPEELVPLEDSFCPNGGRAKTDEKREQLNVLAKVIFFGRALFEDSTALILERLGRFFPAAGNRPWQVFESKNERKQTPHGRKPIVGQGF
jgi:hypothetical protein